MNYSGLDIVAAGEPNYRREDGFYIERRQLLSVTYIRETMDGAVIYLSLVPLGSCFELQLYSGKANESFIVTDLLHEQPCSPNIQELMIKTTVIHDAMPLSYKLPDSSVVVSAMRKDKRKRAPRPHTSLEKRKLSIAEKVARLEQLELFKDWILEPRQRPTGIYDFFYHHKKLKFMCRSRKEVQKFELEGVRPKRPGKAKKVSSLSTDQNVKPDKPMINVTPSKKRTFDEGSSRLSPLEFSQSSSSFRDFARSSSSVSIPEFSWTASSFGIPEFGRSSKLIRTFSSLSPPDFGQRSSSLIPEFGWSSSTLSPPQFDVSSSSLSVPESGRSSNSFIPPENDIIYIPAEEPAHSVEELLKDSYNNLINGVPNPNSDSDATLDGHEEDQEQPDPLSVEQFLVDSLCNLHKASTTTPKPKESKGGKKRSTRKFQQKEKGINLSAKAEDATELFDVPVHFEFEPKNEN